MASRRITYHRIAVSTNQGFIGLQNSFGFYAILTGFLLVGGFIILGAIVSHAIGKEDMLRRQAQREAAEAAKGNGRS